MSTFLKSTTIFLLALFLVAGIVGYKVSDEIDAARSDDPLVWEDSIAKFELQDNPANAILFTGSSSIRFWGSLHEDMAPATVIQRGFGGAKINDMLHFADRLVDVPSPKAIVVFAGTNDISPMAVKPAAEIVADWSAFVEQARLTHPTVPIYYIAITPSLRRWGIWPKAQHANQQIQQAVDADPSQHFIDTTDVLLNDKGEPNRDLYLFDGLHLSGEGYKRWTDVIRGRLIADGLIPAT
jgi:lysophospholipase L1-like esterase